MRKLIIKTASITLAVLIGVVAITMGALLLFTPKTLGGLGEATNNYSFAMYCYELQYNKTKDVYDLGNIVRVVDEKNDVVTTIYYSELLTKDSQFNNYCEQKDKESKADKNDKIMKEADSVYSKYAVSLVINNDFTEMNEICNNYCSTKGYTQFSPYRAVIYACKDMLTVGQLNTLKSTIKNLKNHSAIYNSDGQIENIDTDIQDIDNIISTKGE